MQSPCLFKVSEMLSITFEEGGSDDTRADKQKNREMFWLPAPNPENSAPGYDSLPSVAVPATHRDWVRGTTTPAASADVSTPAPLGVTRAVPQLPQRGAFATTEWE